MLGPTYDTLTNIYFFFGIYSLCCPRFSDPAHGIDPGRGEGQRVRGSTGSNRSIYKIIFFFYI